MNWFSEVGKIFNWIHPKCYRLVVFYHFYRLMPPPQVETNRIFFLIRTSPTLKYWLRNPNPILISSTGIWTRIVLLPVCFKGNGKVGSAWGVGGGGREDGGGERQKAVILHDFLTQDRTRLSTRPPRSRGRGAADSRCWVGIPLKEWSSLHRVSLSRLESDLCGHTHKMGMLLRMTGSRPNK